MRYASRLIIFAAISTAIGTGCGEHGGNAEVAGTDTGSGDAAADTGAGSADTRDDTSLADTLDDSGSGSADTGADTPVDTVDDDAWMAACPEPPQGDQPLAGRWSLSLFHFNIQYVAGGTTGFAEIAANAPASSRLLDMTEQETEDRIVTESIVPLLEILERHPTLALTFELQGYAVDVIRERHPAVLDRMRALVEAGQLELASIHWSDQFFLAFGRRDMERSWEMTQASFATANLPLSPVVFTQEGQFGPGFAAWLAERRPAPSWSSRATSPASTHSPSQTRRCSPTARSPPSCPAVTAARSCSATSPSSTTASCSRPPTSTLCGPRLCPQRRRHPHLRERAALRRAERGPRWPHRRLCGGSPRGRRDARRTPAAARRHLAAQLHARATPLDGGAGDLWSKHERDLEVLRACIGARYKVLELETLLGQPGIASEAQTAAAAAALNQGWRDLLWGEVSDARGVNPWYGEVNYGLDHCNAAASGANAATALLARVGYPSETGLEIDTAAGTVTSRAIEELPAKSSVAAPFAIELDDGGRGASTAWSSWRDEAGDELFELTVDWPALPAEAARFDSCTGGDPTRRWRCVQVPLPMELRLPRAPGFVGLRPALSTSLLRANETDFDLQPNASADAAWVPVSSGLIDLGNGWFAIKEVATSHVAVGWTAGAPANSWVRLRDETRQASEATSWRIWLTQSEPAAIRRADANESPRLWRAVTGR